MKKTKKIIL